MIDFRYHLVSLISVFLALAVGIILGAGPLKEAIGDQLSGQVTSLRTEKEALRADLDHAEATQRSSDAMLTAAAPKLLANALPERNIAILTIGDVDANAVDAVDEALTTSGAHVVSQVQMADQWFSAEKAEARQSYASSLADYLSTGADARGYDATLDQALVLALSGYASAGSETFAPAANIVRQVLVDSGLVTLVGKVTTPADAYVVIAAGASTTTTTAPTMTSAERIVTATFARELSQDAEGAVITTTGSPQGTIVDAVTSDRPTTKHVTTVAGVDTVVGQLMVPLALSERISGSVGAYADTTAEKDLPSAAVLDPPDRSALVALAGVSDGSEPDASVKKDTKASKSDQASKSDEDQEEHADDATVDEDSPAQGEDQP